MSCRRAATAAALCGSLLVLGGCGGSGGSELAAAGPATTPYEEGFRSLQGLDAMAARAQLEAAVAAAPGDVLAWAALAEAHMLLGEDQEAGAAAAKALELRAGLAGTDLFLAEGQAYAARNEWEKAAAALASLAAAKPADPDVAYRLATAQIYRGDPQAALAAVAKLRASPDADPRLEIAATSALRDLGEIRASRAAAEKAIAAAARLGRPMVAARARLWLGVVLQEQGGRTAATAIAATVTEARNAFLEAGDRRGLAQVLQLEGKALLDQGDLKNAEKRLQEGLELYRALGARYGQAGILISLAVVAFDQGRIAESQQLRAQGLALYRDIGATFDVAIVENEVGLAHYERGSWTWRSPATRWRRTFSSKPAPPTSPRW